VESVVEGAVSATRTLRSGPAPALLRPCSGPAPALLPQQASECGAQALLRRTRSRVSATGGTKGLQCSGRWTTLLSLVEGLQCSGALQQPMEIETRSFQMQINLSQIIV
jgi:hypothetical protein